MVRCDASHLESKFFSSFVICDFAKRLMLVEVQKLKSQLHRVCGSKVPTLIAFNASSFVNKVGCVNVIILIVAVTSLTAVVKMQNR